MAKNPWQLPRGYDAATRKALAQIFAALRNARTHITPAAYEALRLGNIQAFINLVDWESIGQNLGELEPILQDFAAKTGVQLYKDGDITADLLFDIVDARAVIWAQNHTADLVVEIAEEMRQQIRNVMAESTQGLLTYEQAARKIRTNLSLTSRDSAAVDSYYSRQINKLVQSGMTIDKATEKANARADRYAAKLLRKRSQTIARTELANAASNGRRLGWESGVSEGYIDPASTKEWVAEPDACDICGPMDGVSVPMNDEFPSGAMMPPQHPNCRCAAILLPPEYSDEYWTAYAKDDRVDTTVTIVKHMAGKHDQSTHGKGGATSNPASWYKDRPATWLSDSNEIGTTQNVDVNGKIAVRLYTDDYYQDVNKILRSDKLQDDYDKARVRELDEILANNKTLGNIALTRITEKGRLPANLKVGDVITDKAYLSTTKLSPFNSEFPAAHQDTFSWTKEPVYLDIRVPKGFPAIDVSSIGSYSAEKEVILPRNTQLQVVAINGIDIELVAIP